jgi:hypothetical protein
MTRFLRWLLPYKDIGWEEIGEEFTRFTLAKTPWFNVYLHRLKAHQAHPNCHDHPWSFVAVLLKGGYIEYCPDGRWHTRKPGSVLYRPATFSHNVVTPGVSWSIIFTTAKFRDWGFKECH